MKTKIFAQRTLLISLFAILVFAIPAFATPPGGYNDYGDPDGFWLGARLGWSGGVNGLTFKKGLAPGHAIELVAGYNPKEGRANDWPTFHKGNMLIGARYQPGFTLGGDPLTAGFYGSIGLTARLHNYRIFRNARGASPLTPDLLAGGGLNVGFGDYVRVFSDIHLKYYNTVSNFYQLSYETGLGIRVLLGS